MTDAELAARLADTAGRLLLALRAAGRWHGDVLGDVADQAADGYLQGALRTRFPEDALRSEESADAVGPTSAWSWIVDPLDGTREYAPGGDAFAVHVGIVRDGGAVGGAVALPALGRVLVAGPAGVAVAGTAGGWPTTVARGDGVAPARLRIVVSRSHTPRLVAALARELGDAELVPCGSVGFKVALLLFGRADVYVHQRGLREWDTCAPEAVARAAGWAVSRLDGTPHRYGRPEPCIDELVVCRPALQPRLLALLAALR